MKKTPICIQNTLIHYVQNVSYLFVPGLSQDSVSQNVFISLLCKAKRFANFCKRNVFHRLVDPNFSTFTVPKSCHYWKGDDPCHLYDIMVICQVSSGDFEFPLSCEDQTAADGSCKSELQL